MKPLLKRQTKQVLLTLVVSFALVAKDDDVAHAKSAVNEMTQLSSLEYEAVEFGTVKFTYSALTPHCGNLDRKGAIQSIKVSHYSDQFSVVGNRGVIRLEVRPIQLYTCKIIHGDEKIDTPFEVLSVVRQSLDNPFALRRLHRYKLVINSRHLANINVEMQGQIEVEIVSDSKAVE